MTSIGCRIKQLRKAKGVPQSELAGKLGVSAQAVSKWENDSALPDMALLPDIAAYFGVAIDDLFAYSREKRYERIENRIVYQNAMSNQEFADAEGFLLREIEGDPEKYEALSLLGSLYLFQAGALEHRAMDCAKRALRLRPNTKADMSTISHAGHGKLYDWNAANHHELIDYWRRLLREEPKNKRAYFYLLDDLIDDGRIREAREVLAESFRENPDTLNEAYAVWLEETVQGFDRVKADYEALAEKYPRDWRVLFNVANSFSHNERYEEAIGYWRRALEAMEPPRYTDFHDAMAQCYERLGQHRQAARMLREEKTLLREDWGVRFGKELDDLDARIQALEAIEG